MSAKIVIYGHNSLKHGIAAGSIPPPRFENEEEVFVMLKSNKVTGKGTVVSEPEKPTSKDCRYRVRYRDGAGEYDVRVTRILKVILGECVIVCAFTEDFRYLARTQASFCRKGELVLEIGCSWGECTKILLEHHGPDNVVAVDISEEAMTETVKRNPTLLRHHCFDAFAIDQEQKLREIMAGQECGICMIDIGGNRQADDVRSMIQLVLTRLGPRQVVVKSEELHAEHIKLDPAPSDGRFSCIAWPSSTEMRIPEQPVRGLGFRV
mmetsp:Transcript_42612/g.66745  ORF Transcript_42612/g.66745 Transcript_42612/m.66745 type:complete len:265 (-) Transcript_42612:24-818(-)|eukprot:CAMPEP_0184288180 /NCGR_PEP_ID=MMETSP1049-20130417/657_1 /TAXON_ID=77928 /ORGANISM="Proteomonas sulcata, Strain CCMP704" /LENGTH=264 /DNA_ID=CAMNT_0026594415 /DNA_START=460 /DNA_END=1254 /DNA_ORIENTATION=-